MLDYVGCLFNSNVNQRQLTSKQLNMLEVIFPYTSYKSCDLVQKIWRYGLCDSLWRHKWAVGIPSCIPTKWRRP